jgi:DNA polymerase III delta prime subunit
MYEQHKICFIDEADYLSKSSQASLRGVIEDTSKICRYIFTANDISKMHPALCSRLMPICFDMTATQVSNALESYTSITIEKLKLIYENLDTERVKRIVELNFPDFRSIANHLQFEFM